MKIGDRAGLAFAFVAIGILAVIVIVLVNSEPPPPPAFRYSVQFERSQGLKPGDAVRLQGVAIGRVAQVDLDRTGQNVIVHLAIEPNHGEKIAANSTAYVPEVPGDPYVEVINPSAPTRPLPQGTTVAGQDSEVELRAWQLKDRVAVAGENFGDAARQLGESVRQFADSFSEDVKESMSGLSEELGAETREFLQSEEFQATLLQLALILDKLANDAYENLQELADEWNELKLRIGPLLAELKRIADEVVFERVYTALREIGRLIMERLDELGILEYTPDEPVFPGAPAPEPSDETPGPVKI